MIISTINGTIKAEDLVKQIEIDGYATYQIEEVEFEDIQGVQRMLVDNIIDNHGDLLQDVSNRFVGVKSDGTAIIQVTAWEVEDFLDAVKDG